MRNTVGLERAAGSGGYDESVCQAGAEGPLTQQLHKLQPSHPGPRSTGWATAEVGSPVTVMGVSLSGWEQWRRLAPVGEVREMSLLAPLSYHD